MSGHDSFPACRGSMEYVCLNCKARFPGDELFYTCPECKGVFLLEDTNFENLKRLSGKEWRNIFDERAKTKKSALRGIFRFYEIIAPVLEERDIVYLGEGQTPIIEAAPELSRYAGIPLAYKNDGQNPSASFKDRGMACAFSAIRSMIGKKGWKEVLAVCASTGDTSASAALYAAYVGEKIKSVVILPHGKVTPQQLAQPLGSGAVVLEVPGVFDDCMKVVEYLADNYNVALLNSKNAWRILGQESYSFEIAQWYDWRTEGKCVFVPIGNAGNITAVMRGFLKLLELEIIDTLPRIFGVQSAHADPVYRFYREEDASKRVWKPVEVTASTAQAAMIGNPVSMPRVRHLAEKYVAAGGEAAFQVVQVSEQEIIEGMLSANRHGHIACTQGGECLAGLLKARELKLITPDEHAILDATAHSLKFIGFQDMYFSNTFPPEYEITPKPELANAPQLLVTQADKDRMSRDDFTAHAANAAVKKLGLTPR